MTEVNTKEILSVVPIHKEEEALKRLRNLLDVVRHEEAQDRIITIE